MRLNAVFALLLPLLLLGCISIGEQMGNGTNQSNATQPPANETINVTQNESPGQNQTAPPAEYERFNASGFSFEYPANMDTDISKGASSGIFSGTHLLQAGQTGEVLIVRYYNTKVTYGENQDDLFKADPTGTASDFLQAEKKNDPAGSILNKAYEVGELTTFTVARDASAAKLSFKTKFNTNRTYYGHAMSIYIPERSTYVSVRILALDLDKADSIRDDFLLSFRIEAP